MKRRTIAAALLLSPWLAGVEARAEGPRMTVYKSPSCGCCAGWVEHVEAAGFEVEVKNLEDLSQVKQLAGVPAQLQACHTATLDGRIIEGHVPAHAIKAFMASASDARGIAVPGMPQGSPGMPSPQPERYEVIAFGGTAPAVVGTYLRDMPVAD